MSAMRSTSAARDLHAVHVLTRGMYCDQCTALVECTVSRLPGVCEVTAVRTMGLTSILFDQSLIDGGTIARAIRGIGFAAEVASAKH